ncbi:putative DNA binding domain-containing protein [Gluconacetobacter azotocaptans]|uniref:RNA-binding domain-containing protein n=1 Tax=Gluconacetobacter azotocaptans TaxID=142834 RepID=UPI00195E9CA8|nr:RNA-binding domain-containing protein [Gluconacetobacter azotocaptans]MBM9400783.1 putative DNA binding domain-containing protein [Gluconacetobacter azotocaptans]
MSCLIETFEGESNFAKRADVFSMIERGVADEAVLNTILAGSSRWDEPELWDFKLELPFYATGIKPSDSARAERDSKVDEIVKDAVAFYNSFGGYIIVGVADQQRSVSGFDKRFDVESLNKRIRSATGQSVECIYRTLPWKNLTGEIVQLGLLFIPRRAPSILPAQFKVGAHKSSTGQYAFKKEDFYLRQLDECRPATSAEDFAFLYADERRRITLTLPPVRAFMENNLPDRDGELGKFIGREADMAALWGWLSDRFSPVRLICGLGGVGKTSLAYQFAELFAYARPAQFDKLVWLGAKIQTWHASRDQYVALQRVDFFSVDDFLSTLAAELGCPQALLEEANSRQDLMDLTVEHLSEFRFLVVVDDVDTLQDEDQQVLYHIVSTVFAQAKSKLLMTARRNLGMPRAHYIELGGIDEDDYADFVESKCILLRIPNPAVSDSTHLADLLRISGGSPLFTVSILRFVSLGETLQRSLRLWSGAAGEKVRDAAFAKEVGRLSPAHARVLLAAVYLRQTSPVELAAVVGISDYDVSEALDKLRDFSMVEVASELPGGATILIPTTLSLMNEVIEARIANYKTLRDACFELRSIHADPVPFVMDAVRRCMAHLTNKDTKGATRVVDEALGKLPEHPDLVCLLARCKFTEGGHSRTDAIALFKKAESLGCRRSELFEMWVEALQQEREWEGVVDVIRRAEMKLSSPGRFSVARANACLQRADLLIRANRYKEAEKVSLDASEDIRNLLKNQMPSLFRDDTRTAQKVVIRKWLEAIRIQCRSSVECGRLLGAVVKAIQHFGWLDVPTAELAISLGAERYRTLDQRVKFSQSSYESIALFAKRVNILQRQAERLPKAASLVTALTAFKPLVDGVLSKAATGGHGDSPFT